MFSGTVGITSNLLVRLALRVSEKPPQWGNCNSAHHGCLHSYVNTCKRLKTPSSVHLKTPASKHELIARNTFICPRNIFFHHDPWKLQRNTADGSIDHKATSNAVRASVSTRFDIMCFIKAYRSEPIQMSVQVNFT
jgi:hypothetical protein